MPEQPSVPDLDPSRFATHAATVRGTRLEYLHEGAGRGAVPLLALHGWPETRRVWWRAVPLLVAAGFEVVAPDLRGFGGSDPGADGRGDVVAHALDMVELLEQGLKEAWCRAQQGTINKLAANHNQQLKRIIKAEGSWVNY